MDLARRPGFANACPGRTEAESRGRSQFWLREAHLSLIALAEEAARVLGACIPGIFPSRGLGIIWGWGGCRRDPRWGTGQGRDSRWPLKSPSFFLETPRNSFLGFEVKPQAPNRLEGRSRWISGKVWVIKWLIRNDGSLHRRTFGIKWTLNKGLSIFHLNCTL